MPNYDSGPIQGHPVVSRDEWLAARVALLEREKEFNRRRDELVKQRRALPWELVAKPYAFDTAQGRRTLPDLFDGRRQLVMYHFMFATDWKEGCKHCSFWADNFDVRQEHLNQRDTTFVVVSRAALDTLEAFKDRMGWRFNWVSSSPSDFNVDFGVSFTTEQIRDGSAIYNYRDAERGPEREGASAFYRGEDGSVYHTYSTYARGIDLINTTYNLLDLTAKGRDEGHLSDSQAWVRLHDRYAGDGRSSPAASERE